jgi:hypothetical protein
VRACKNIECPFIRSNRKAARFDDEAMTCTHCGGPLSAAFVPEGAGARSRTTNPRELGGVPVDSLGLCIGPWCSVAGGRGGAGFALTGAAVAAVVGIVMLAARQPVAGTVLVVGGAGIAMWCAIVFRPQAVRLYDRGFEYQRGSMSIGIAYANLRDASLTITEVRHRGIRIGWEASLAVAWDVGALRLSGVTHGAGPEPEGPFYDFAVVVVRAFQSRVA